MNLLEILKDKTLFYCGQSYVDRAIDVCSKINKPIDSNYNIFVYWIGDNVNYKHSVVLKSFLATQNLKNATLKIYSDIDLSNKEIFKPYVEFPNIEFHIFDIESEIKNTVYQERFKYCEDIKLHRFNPAYESDFFRILMLYKYGGFYIDFDVILLRDLSPLLMYDFVYQWGCSPNSDWMNGAIMHLRKDSMANNKMTEKLLSTPASPGEASLSWASQLYKSVIMDCPELIMLPSAFFNTEWQLPDKYSLLSPMLNYEMSKELYEGAFTWHWHNSWETPIQPGSKFDLLDLKITKVFNEKFKI